MLNCIVLNPHNDEEYQALLRRVIANARAIITYQVGLPSGCLRMQRLFLCLQPRRTFEFSVFDEYLMVVRPFATGPERLHWNRQLLFEQDREFEEINRSYRDPVHNACYDLIEQLETEVEGPP
jgi:hypothetical protein